MTNNSKNVKTTKPGFYKPENLTKFADALKNAREENPVKVTISNNNSKMGAVASVSLLPFLTCPGCCGGTCGRKCYAAKLALLRPVVRHSYAVNTALAFDCPEAYWEQVRVALSVNRFFRFHVSGDIPNADYFARMIEAVKAAPHCEVLIFTKQYAIVNAWIDANGDLPANLHLLFSGWDNLTPDNPHKLPETNVFGTESQPEPRADWLLCGGNCEQCACRGVGCWQAKRGETIAFKLH